MGISKWYNIPENPRTRGISEETTDPGKKKQCVYMTGEEDL